MIFSVLASFALISHAQEPTFESSLTTEDEFAKWSVIDANNDTKPGDSTVEQPLPNTVIHQITLPMTGLSLRPSPPPTAATFSPLTIRAAATVRKWTFSTAANPRQKP